VIIFVKHPNGEIHFNSRLVLCDHAAEFLRLLLDESLSGRQVCNID